MWQTKTFKTQAAMEKWLARHGENVQWEEIAVNNAWGIIYRALRIM